MLMLDLPMSSSIVQRVHSSSWSHLKLIEPARHLQGLILDALRILSLQCPQS